MATCAFTNAVAAETGGSSDRRIIRDNVTIHVTDGDADNNLNRDNTDPDGDQTFVFPEFTQVLAVAFEPVRQITCASIDGSNRGTGGWRRAGSRPHKPLLRRLPGEFHQQ